MLPEWKQIRSKKITPVYLIIGTEDYIINETKQLLIDNILEGEEVEFNYANLDLEEMPIEVVVQEAESMPFFGDKRLVMANNPLFLTTEKSKNKVEHDTAKLEAYLNEPVDYSVLCFVARVEKLDERKKLTKLLKKTATVIEAKRPNENELKKWIEAKLSENNMQMSQEAITRLIELTSGQLTTAMNELQKLMLYCFDSKEITIQDVESLVVRSLEQNIFLMLDKMIAMDIGGALRIYYDLLKQKEEPIKILALISSQFRLLNQLKVLEQQGYSQQQAATKLKVHPFRVKLASKQAKNFTELQLNQALKRLAEIDLEMKTGFGDKEQKLEWFLFELQDNRQKRV
ncbi:DNA polymerase III subunit delta [Listeria monocytogenes]|uniref:DNA polymerase III subunit delta n=1 Tax=Listeria monocytogenes TaxID=1639 RepID=UPI0010B51B51|nr:DNA polymerase III subunit delta [Listeria monocytogenes]EAC8325541.1 DNA polymerase III subunit delta [Listeria monocytogenes]EAC8329200.1 DNA polymerase III subunit delta [Listeria monocytogenes]EAC8634682.1 DNA polymerase III subunit delta [Listeria monocytogenes]EAG0757523.1 DNA polymerase III subunit delta [Listeria monocytogenes]ECB9820922.1 DNA polymerase III subunit delta [Listeria monocytogenes]